MVVRRPRSSRRHQKGTSLIECVVSIAILGTAIVSGVELFGVQQKTWCHQREATQVRLILNRELESLRERPFASILSSGWNTDSNYPQYEVRHVVTDVDLVTKEILVRVRWIGPQGQTKKAEAATLRCRDAP